MVMNKTRAQSLLRGLLNGLLSRLLSRILIGVLIWALALGLTACGAIPGFSPSDSNLSGVERLPDGRQTKGYAGGWIGEEMRTQWFSFSVDGVKALKTYGDYPAPDGGFLLVASITVQNPYSEAVPMSLYDFQVQWGSGDLDYAYGIEESSMPVDYVLEAGESYTGDVVFQVPLENEGEYAIAYLEIYEDGEEGNVFFLYFDEEDLDFSAY